MGTCASRRWPKSPRATEAAKGACSLRIISINDVYELDNLPRLKSLVAEKSAGWPCENVVTCLAGDFLAPSLLSSLDAGMGMVKVLNNIPVDLVCFGNHESDIPYNKLLLRISEYQGTWLNSNMPDFEPELPRYALRRLRSEAGAPGARTVAFLGLCIGGGPWGIMYREGAFGGAAVTMVPVLEAARHAHAELRAKRPEVDEVVPLTHQDLREDRLLAGTGLFPVIVAGHDHDVVLERHGPRSCPVVKAGSDATHAAVIDLRWRSAAADTPPVVTVTHIDLSTYEPDPELVVKIERIKRPVLELETATVYELPVGEEITSVGARYHEVSMGRLVATALRECLHCDAAIINSGAVRGNRAYVGGISYGDLKRECPFPSPIVVIRMPFSILREAVQSSRRPWWDIAEGGSPREAASALQVDEGIRIDSQHRPVSIYHKIPKEEEELCAVACDTRVLKRNDVLKQYCKRFPERVPPDDAGRPVLPLLVEFFCGQLWRRLIDSTTGPKATPSAWEASSSRRAVIEDAFDIFDHDRDGLVNQAELTRAVERRLGHQLSSRIVVEQMIAMLDIDNDGMLTQAELRHGMTKIVSGVAPKIASL